MISAFKNGFRTMQPEAAYSRGSMDLRAEHPVVGDARDAWLEGIYWPVDAARPLHQEKDTLCSSLFSQSVQKCWCIGLL